MALHTYPRDLYEVERRTPDAEDQLLLLDHRQHLEKTSKFYKLSPFLGKRGVVRMDSRISNISEALYDFKYPVVLPKNHFVTQLIVDNYHRRYNHCNGETAEKEMRQIPFVGDESSFSEVSEDLFLVSGIQGNSIRSMNGTATGSTGDYLCQGTQFRRVGPIRTTSDYPGSTLSQVLGCPLHLFNHQGNLSVQPIYRMLLDGFTTRGNLPKSIAIEGLTLSESAAWERMVRLVKCALAALSAERKPNEEILVTLLVEESVVYSNPLTNMPLETAEHEAFTPNCFLLLSTSGVNQPSSQLSDDKLANVF